MARSVSSEMALDRRLMIGVADPVLTKVVVRSDPSDLPHDSVLLFLLYEELHKLFGPLSLIKKKRVFSRLHSYLAQVLGLKRHEILEREASGIFCATYMKKVSEDQFRTLGSASRGVMLMEPTGPTMLQQLLKDSGRPLDWEVTNVVSHGELEVKATLLMPGMLREVADPSSHLQEDAVVSWYALPPLLRLCCHFPLCEDVSLAWA